MNENLCEFEKTEVQYVWKCKKCGVETFCKHVDPPFRPCPAIKKGVSRRRVRKEGPGTELKYILSTFGFYETSNCQCKAFASQMNAWGIEGCRQRLDSHIVPYLIKQFKRRKKSKKGLSIGAKALITVIPETASKVLARRVALRALRNAKKKEDKANANKYR